MKFFFECRRVTRSCQVAWVCYGKYMDQNSDMPDFGMGMPGDMQWQCQISSLVFYWFLAFLVKFGDVFGWGLCFSYFRVLVD